MIIIKLIKSLKYKILGKIDSIIEIVNIIYQFVINIFNKNYSYERLI